jgi:MerR family transcriptional regulator, light-induced transcriptional regulator
MPAEPEVAKLTVAAVARRLGVAPATLRTWDRRYGLGPSEHCLGEHRKYSKSDLGRLVYMHNLVISGVSPADAANLARNHIENSAHDAVAPVPVIDGQLVNSLLRAANLLDRASIENVIRSQIDKNGVSQTWMNLLVPLLCAIGEKWERTGTGIASEHMVSDVIKRILSERVVVAQPRNAAPVLVACVGEEMHSLAITALAASLAEEDIQVQFLGARTPIEAIVEVVSRCAPPAIFLWAQTSEHASLEAISALPAVRPSPRVILGGPGWAGTECAGAYYAEDLTAACREISQALGL